MKVKELIAKLQEFDGELEVIRRLDFDTSQSFTSFEVKMRLTPTISLASFDKMKTEEKLLLE